MSAIFITFFTFLALSAGVPTPTRPLQSRQNGHLNTQSGQGVWDAGAVTEFPIHSSCNATEARQLRVGLTEAIELAEHAKEHVLRWGNSSEHYRKYFGSAPSGEVIGNLDKIVSGDKGGVLFRCDNPDGNCELDGWGGHWRGENGTDETVICPLSYETRRSLTQMCGMGYTVAESETNTFWASDLIHRLYHMPAFGEGVVEHYAEEGYEGILELAENNATWSTRDSDTLQYFALDVYAYDIAVPGIGCPGSRTVEPVESDSVASATSTPEAASTTTAAPAECHTHSNGDVHCD